MFKARIVGYKTHLDKLILQYLNKLFYSRPELSYRVDVILVYSVDMEERLSQGILGADLRQPMIETQGSCSSGAN